VGVGVDGRRAWPGASSLLPGPDSVLTAGSATGAKDAACLLAALLTGDAAGGVEDAAGFDDAAGFGGAAGTAEDGIAGASKAAGAAFSADGTLPAGTSGALEAGADADDG
jgi:hypothetical protein